MDPNLQKKKVRLVEAILRFLKHEEQNGELDPDGRESLEVAIQCLESAYNLEGANGSGISTAPNLLDVLDTASGQQVLSDEEKAKAEKEKTAGNEHMKAGRFQEAVEAYSKAVTLNPNNAVYYCNRAAAYSKLEKHEEAIADCNQAVKLDPCYGKAYGRLGIAYSSLGRYQEAKTAYTIALQMDPNNSMYEANLKVVEDRLEGGTAGTTPPPEFMNLIGNPNFINIASQVLTEPAFRNVVTGMIHQGSDPNISVLVQAGQQLAAHLMNTNPNLVESLRRNYMPEYGNDGEGGNQGLGEGPAHGGSDNANNPPDREPGA